MTDDEQMIADCEARESHLTEWEQGFVQSLRDQVDRGRALTDRQAETLERVWARVTHKG